MLWAIAPVLYIYEIVVLTYLSSFQALQNGHMDMRSILPPDCRDFRMPKSLADSQNKKMAAEVN